MNILGIKYGGHDTASALMVDGEIAAACAQERFSLDKHSSRFPKDAIIACLHRAGLKIEDIDHIAFVNDLKKFIREMYIRPALQHDYRVKFILSDIDSIRESCFMDDVIREKLDYSGQIGYYSHHLCHLASAYYPSGFSQSLLLSHDGMGEHECAMLGIGDESDIKVLHDRNVYPNSLGLIYSALTFYLGWQHHCDEGIVMGLASYGNPHAKLPGIDRTYYSIFEEIILDIRGFDFEINLDWINYHKLRSNWVSNKFYETFGPKREYGEEITPHYKHIAAALQLRLETVVLNQLRWAKKETGLRHLGLAGGVALNCSMNGKIEAAGIFDEIFVQPASGDDGTTIGACYLAHKAFGGQILQKKRKSSYLGSRYSTEDITSILSCQSNYEVKKPDDIYKVTAERIYAGKIVGWFQGAAEFGPRALGNRSILARPYPESMKDQINSRVKFREYFRPFAPAVLAEDCEEYFEIKQDSPHMLIACQVRKDKMDEIPAVVHIDGSCRVQTVNSHINERFYNLLIAVKAMSGIPVVLNTSFNVKGQPIVNSPQQALDCFQSTEIDCLVMDDYLLEK